MLDLNVPVPPNTNSIPPIPVNDHTNLVFHCMHISTLHVPGLRFLPLLSSLEPRERIQDPGPRIPLHALLLQSAAPHPTLPFFLRRGWPDSERGRDRAWRGRVDGGGGDARVADVREGRADGHVD